MVRRKLLEQLVKEPVNMHATGLLYKFDLL